MIDEGKVYELRKELKLNMINIMGAHHNNKKIIVILDYRILRLFLRFFKSRITGLDYFEVFLSVGLQDYCRIIMINFKRPARLPITAHTVPS